MREASSLAKAVWFCETSTVQKFGVGGSSVGEAKDGGHPHERRFSCTASSHDPSRASLHFCNDISFVSASLCKAFHLESLQQLINKTSDPCALQLQWQGLHFRFQHCAGGKGIASSF